MLPLSAVVPMDVAQQAYVQVRAEERVRYGNDINAAETELNPQLRYDFIWSGGQNHFVAIYQPRFVYTHAWNRRDPNPKLINPQTLNQDPINANPLSALHNGGFGFEAVRPRWRLSLYQFGAYGPVTTTTLLVQVPWDGASPPPDPNPIIPSIIAGRFTLLFLQTQLFAPIRLSRRTALIPGFVYNAFGGANPESRGVIALTQGPGVSLAVDHAASQNDRFVTTVGAGLVETKFEDDTREGATIRRVEGTQSWRHWYTAKLSSELMAGGSVGGDDINGYSVFSLGQAALLYDNYGQTRIAPGAPPMGPPPGRGNRLQLGLSARVAPWIDLFSGELEQRGTLNGAINYTVDRTLFRGYLGTGKVFNTPRSVAEYQIIFAEGGIRYRITPIFSVDTGVRYGYQDFDNAVRFNSLSQFTIFGGLFLAPFPARF
jgi:hypothetical protein